MIRPSRHDYRPPRPGFSRRMQRACELIAGAVIVFYGLYLCAHIVAAYLRGSFEVIAR